MGGHWAALQTVAWTGMLASNARAFSLAEAITRTFDGQHPCRLCKAIIAGKQAEQQQPATKISVKIKLDLGLPPLAGVFAWPDHARASLPDALRYHERTDAPPTPPPRIQDFPA
jgi:hypothetical protein